MVNKYVAKISESDEVFVALYKTLKSKIINFLIKYLKVIYKVNKYQFW